MNVDKVTNIAARIGGPDGPGKSFRGRFAWALAHLLQAGETGISTIERPAPRWSHYVFRLRRQGVTIETMTEAHDGTYRGRHGRYVLRASVKIVEYREAG